MSHLDVVNRVVPLGALPGAAARMVVCMLRVAVFCVATGLCGLEDDQ